MDRKDVERQNCTDRDLCGFSSSVKTAEKTRHTGLAVAAKFAVGQRSSRDISFLVKDGEKKNCRSAC